MERPASKFPTHHVFNMTLMNNGRGRPKMHIQVFLQQGRGCTPRYIPRWSEPRTHSETMPR
jgi:hypothetical protein